MVSPSEERETLQQTSFENVNESCWSFEGFALQSSNYSIESNVLREQPLAECPCGCGGKQTATLMWDAEGWSSNPMISFLLASIQSVELKAQREGLSAVKVW